EWKLEEVKSFVDYKNYSIEGRRSREYTIKAYLIEGEAELRSKMTTADYLADLRVDYRTGRPVKRQTKSQLYTESRNDLPPLVRAVIETFRAHQVTVNVRAIEAHLQCLLLSAQRICDVHGRNSELYESAYRSYENDRNCFDAILDQDFVLDG